MNPVSSLPAIAATLLAFITTWALLKKFPTTAENGRFLSIDGLRGYLAFFVFLHHAKINGPNQAKFELAHTFQSTGRRLP